jgi:hypothetical protein
MAHGFSYSYNTFKPEQVARIPCLLSHSDNTYLSSFCVSRKFTYWYFSIVAFIEIQRKLSVKASKLGDKK